jgi:hypothetical protein
MLKMAKRFTAAAMTLVLSMGISFTAMAAQSAPQVQLNGKNLTFTTAKPLIRQGSLYLPARIFSDEIGAEIVYDADTKITSITKDSTAVHFSVGSPDISITKDGITQVTKATAASLNINNQIYVPVRFAEQAFGYSVNWDEDAQTAVIVDKNTLLNQISGQFTLMDNYMAYSQAIAKDTYAIKGSFQFNATSADSENGAIKMEGNISGISNSDVANMNMALKMDTEVLKKLMDTETKEDQTAVALLDSLKDIKMDIIFNTTTGKYYVSSSIFANPMLKAMGMDENTWYYFDLNELFKQSGQEISLDKLMAAAKSGSFETYIKSYLDMMPMDDVSSYQTAQEFIDILNKFFSDSAFKKEKNNYTANYTFRQDNTYVTLTTTLTGKENIINGCIISMNVKQDGKNMLTMNMTQDKLDTKMNMNIDVPNLFSASLDMDMKMEKTTAQPMLNPPADSKVVSINELLSPTSVEVEAKEEIANVEPTVTEESAQNETVAETPAIIGLA